MTVGELIEFLLKQDPEADVCISTSREAVVGKLAGHVEEDEGAVWISP
jgi:hypothetical protein